jgi:hypothetical protein
MRTVTAIAAAAAAALVVGACGSPSAHRAGRTGDEPSDVETTSSGDETTSPDATDPGDSSDQPAVQYSPHRGQWFFAALPSGWRVDDETANGIDISSPDSVGGVSFEYLHGSAAAAVAGGAPVDADGFADWLLRSQGAEQVRTVASQSLGRFTDAVGATWSFIGREIEAVDRGDRVHAVLEVGTATDAYGDWVGMAWQRVTRADAWDDLAGQLAAVSRSITILQVQSTGGRLRMPATDATSGDVSATQDDVESRLSQDREAATLGYETLVDPTTGDHYDAPLESYDAARGGYFVAKPGGDQQLEPEP